MYRYSVDNAVTYTPDDLALFRESPFALWMERLTLENPDHGILPDPHSTEPHQSIERQDDIVDTLRAEGRNVALIDWDQEESLRRSATRTAMEDGADFIVNGALSGDSLAGTANLLMRTSGFSELGDFLYVPCDTQGQGTFVSAFRLCFLSDLLQQSQGQLPPQMLLIRGDADVMPLQTEDHIYYYRAVKKRFLDAMQSFRKHRMPDPAESSHFGRWSECASEVLKQRALSEEAAEQQLESGQGEAPDARVDMLDTAAADLEDETPAKDYFSHTQPELADEDDDELILEESLHTEPAQVAATGGSASRSYDQPDARTDFVRYEANAARASNVTQTLAEQASHLQPGTYQPGSGPGRTPNLARFPRAVATAPVENTGEPAEAPPSLRDFTQPSPKRRASDIALQNLEFIGSGPDMPFDTVEQPEEPCEGLQIASAPPPNLRHLTPEESTGGRPHHPERRHGRLPDLEPPEPALLPPETGNGRKPHPLDTREQAVDPAVAASVDSDGAPPAALTPVVGAMADATLAETMRSSTLNGVQEPEAPTSRPAPDAKLSDEPPWAPSRTFSDSLITSERIDDF